jgi:hypothetical protein
VVEEVVGQGPGRVVDKFRHPLPHRPVGVAGRQPPHLVASDRDALCSGCEKVGAVLDGEAA